METSPSCRDHCSVDRAERARPQRSCTGLALSRSSACSPVRHDVFSGNGLFVLDVDPANGNHVMYEASDRSRPLWSFTTRVWHEPLVAADDGKTVARLAWSHVTIEQMKTHHSVAFWDASGESKAHSFAEVCPDPLHAGVPGPAPMGDFWRTWLYDLHVDGSRLRVETTGRSGTTFSLSDGSILATHRQFIPARVRHLRPLGLVLAAIALAVLIVRGARWRRSGPSLA